MGSLVRFLRLVPCVGCPWAGVPCGASVSLERRPTCVHVCILVTRRDYADTMERLESEGWEVDMDDFGELPLTRRRRPVGRRAQHCAHGLHLPVAGRSKYGTAVTLCLPYRVRRRLHLDQPVGGAGAVALAPRATQVMGAATSAPRWHAAQLHHLPRARSHVLIA